MEKRQRHSTDVSFLVLERSRMRRSFYKRKISCLPLHYAVFNKTEAMKMISRHEYLVHKQENLDGGSLVQGNKFLFDYTLNTTRIAECKHFVSH